VIVGAVLAASLVAGVLLIVQGAHRVKHPSLRDRVLPYVRDVHPAIAPAKSSTLLGQVAGRWRAIITAIGESLGSNAAIARRLRRLSEPADVEQFRVRQGAAGATGLGIALAVSLVAWSVSRPPVISLLLLCATGLIGGCLFADQRLSAQVRAHEAEVRAQFPTIADLLSLSVAAGESPLSALERVTRVAHGALVRDLTQVVADVRAGATLVVALDDLAGRTGVSAVARFAESMAVAIDRGTPLVDVLHAQSADVRESARRDLIESGGKREIAMMVPVVFGILPVTLAFAFFPGLVGLHLTSGG